MKTLKFLQKYSEVSTYLVSGLVLLAIGFFALSEAWSLDRLQEPSNYLMFLIGGLGLISMVIFPLIGHLVFFYLENHSTGYSKKLNKLPN